MAKQLCAPRLVPGSRSVGSLRTNSLKPWRPAGIDGPRRTLGPSALEDLPRLLRPAKNAPPRTWDLRRDLRRGLRQDPGKGIRDESRQVRPANCAGPSAGPTAAFGGLRGPSALEERQALRPAGWAYGHACLVFLRALESWKRFPLRQADSRHNRPAQNAGDLRPWKNARIFDRRAGQMLPAAAPQSCARIERKPSHFHRAAWLEADGAPGKRRG